MRPRDARWLATAHEQQLRSQAMRIDLANRGRYRSTYLLDELFFDLVRVASPDLFVEAGAFDAEASRRVVRSVGGVRAVAFEANPSNFALWTEQVDFVAAGVEYLPLALSDTPGPITFHLRSSEPGESSSPIEDNSILPWAGTGRVFSEEVIVEGTTLDVHFADHRGRAAMWIDVEGANREVISGGEDLLRRCDVVKIEVEDIALWEGQWLAVDALAALLEVGLTPVARDVQTVGQYNVVLISDELARRGESVRALEDFLRAQSRPELPGVLGQLRRNESARRAARRVRERLQRG